MNKKAPLTLNSENHPQNAQSPKGTMQETPQRNIQHEFVVVKTTRVMSNKSIAENEQLKILNANLNYAEMVLLRSSPILK